MGSKTNAVSSRRSGVALGAHKQLNNMQSLTHNNKSKICESSSSEDEDINDTNVNDDKSDSDGVDEEMSVEDVSSVDEENVINDGDESEKDLNDSGSSDDDGSRTVEDGDGVDFSDSDDNDVVDDNDVGDDEEMKNAEDGDANETKVAANPAWAQAMAKILRTQKPSGKKAVVLSKARTIQAAESAAVHKEEEPDFEVVLEKEVKPQVKSEDTKPTSDELLHAKRERLAQCRVKQEDFDYNRERALSKIATKGVVQLFNAVRSQQKNLGSKLAEAHSTRMEEKLLKSIDKDAFLEHLTGKIRSRPVEVVAKTIKKEEGEILVPKSWDELSKKVESSSWDKVIEIKDEPED